MFQRRDVASLTSLFGEALDPTGTGAIETAKFEHVLVAIGLAEQDANDLLRNVGGDVDGHVRYRDALAWLCGHAPPPGNASDAALAKLQLMLTPVYLGRGSAFATVDRRRLGLEGLVPPVVETLDHRAKRWKAMLDDEPEPLKKYLILSQLQATDIPLFYRLLTQHLEELLPVVYTPTVGTVCLRYSHVYRHEAGMFISFFEHRGRVREILRNWVMPVDIIVVTDGGRILGLGDLGVNGMGIPIGKISLYVAGAGFDPVRSLPVTLDCGTDRAELLEDEFYLGAKAPRISDADHAAFVEEFTVAVNDRWPGCLVQYEDFATERAFAVLKAMQKRCLCFNDDIQGTGSVVLAGFINGMRSQGTLLAESRVVFYGAGSSAVGVAMQIAQLLQSEGLSDSDARARIYMLDTKGLITVTRGDNLPEHKKQFARVDGTPDMKTLLEVISAVKPHALFGLSGGGRAFDRTIIEAMCAGEPRPLIFPLSNPTSKAEVTAEDAYAFSQGSCIFAAGSPFDPVIYDGKTLVPGQANNVLVFPGIGFGAWAVGATECADEFFIEAARELAACVSDEEIANGTVYPPVSLLRWLSTRVAARVASVAYAMGLATLEPKPEHMEAYITELMYDPSYGF